ncbi:5-oxoprolinase subunit C family protein [Pontibacillus litoralis]|uniref:KipI antagonist n=1 Tax=Pontibacillus litoralis JSM 072002 TaxID=1385512 RepID=A0A0A5G6S3_9BACI|nr:biotin-dependent carboxyltransferase family protein [Pontibacillus litoralis]KGX86868.1 KipI antagonist [Pontibacillus litoralis JSM 072002]
MILIHKPGMLTTIQDKGRYGFQKQGIIVSGAMDQTAHRIANLLVGNSEDCATIEATIAGPKLEFEQDALISLCGGEFNPSIDGHRVKQWCPVIVRKGSVLTFGQAKNGCRCYLAVAGGIQVDVVMGSRSTYLRAGIGGKDGRGLRAGDRLPIGTPASYLQLYIDEIKNKSFISLPWSVTHAFRTKVQNNQPVRVMISHEYHLFSKKSQQAFFNEPFTISSQSDRMGYRLNGPTLPLAEEQSMLSEAVVFGTIQVPSNGEPIVLLADRQTTGGYPRIAQIASVDLPIFAQLKPGATITFHEITLEEAQRLYMDRERAIKHLTRAITLQYQSRIR